MKKYLKDKYMQIAACVLAGLFCLLLPLLYIGMYTHPCADDFTYGIYTHAIWQSTHSVGQTLRWALYQVKSTYDTWQGTFSSVFLMALSPAVWNGGVRPDTCNHAGNAACVPFLSVVGCFD